MLLRPYLHKSQWREVILFAADQIEEYSGEQQYIQFITDILTEIQQAATNLDMKGSVTEAMRPSSS